MGRELRVDYAWAGIFGMVMDFLPVVGRVPGLDDVWVAGGYSGHGNVLGFACGELVASGGARGGRAADGAVRSRSPAQHRLVTRTRVGRAGAVAGLACPPRPTPRPSLPRARPQLAGGGPTSSIP